MRSGDVRRYASAATLLLLGGALGGCVETTQQKNARAQLQADRLLASRSSVHVTQLDPHVAVLNVRMLRSAAGTAIVVTMRNEGPKSVSDLPVNVGVQTRRGASYLNRAPELPYFQTHVAGIGAKAQVTLAFTSPRAAPAGRAFARVGPSAIATDAGVTLLPAIASSVTSVSSRPTAAHCSTLRSRTPPTSPRPASRCTRTRSRVNASWRPAPHRSTALARVRSGPYRSRSSATPAPAPCTSKPRQPTSDRSRR